MYLLAATRRQCQLHVVGDLTLLKISKIRHCFQRVFILESLIWRFEQEQINVWLKIGATAPPLTENDIGSLCRP